MNAQILKLGEAKITRGGQVTLNKRVRETMKIEEGDYIIFRQENEKIFIIPGEVKPK